VEARPPERPGAWHPLQTLCASHAALAILPNGRLLADLVRAAGLQVEGPGLAFLLNPVEVAGRRAWTSWAGPAYAVHWPVFPGRDAFELELFHRPELLDILCLLHAHEELLRGEAGSGALHAYASAVGWQAFEALQWLCGMAWRRDRYASVLSARGKACADSMAEAHDLMMEVGPGTMPAEEMAPRISELLALARRRFAAFAQEWALDFESDKPLEEIFNLLSTRGPWQWLRRDKDAFGPYLSAHPFGMRLRLYDLDGYHSNGPTYTLEVGMRAPCPLRREEVDAVVSELLTRIGARHVTPGETFD
jgi:hypothetical protein